MQGDGAGAGPGKEAAVGALHERLSRADPKVIYGLYGGIQVSRDGGLSWTLGGRGPQQVIDLAASPSEPGTVLAGTAAGLMQSTDFGTTWALAGPQSVAATMAEGSSCDN